MALFISSFRLKGIRGLYSSTGKSAGCFLVLGAGGGGGTFFSCVLLMACIFLIRSSRFSLLALLMRICEVYSCI
jgi:hypothetical protein